MKKKVEVKFKDQWELAVALRDGREIYYGSGDDVLYYEERKNGSPFRIGDSGMGFSWNINNSTYHEMVEAPWTDRLKDGVKIRCWVSNDDLSEAEMIKNNALIEIAGYRKQCWCPYFTKAGTPWRYAIPAKAKDLNLLENLEDV